LVPHHHVKTFLPQTDKIGFHYLSGGTLHVYFARFRQLPQLTWFMQSLCRFRECCATDHIRQTQLLEDSASNGHFTYASVKSQVRLPHAGKIHLCRVLMETKCDAENFKPLEVIDW